MIYKSASRSKTSIFTENAKFCLKILFWKHSECNKILLSDKNSKKNWNFLPKTPPNKYDPRAHVHNNCVATPASKIQILFYHLQQFEAKKPAVSDRLSLGSRLARVWCPHFQHLDPEPQWQQLQRTFSSASTSASNSQTKNMPNCHILQGSNTLILIALPNIFALLSVQI